jgi:hydrogenase maturation protease
MSNDGNKTILIGIGNPFRRDDGIGVHIVRELKKRLAGENDEMIDILECSGEGVDLISNWEGYQNVYLFDAVMSHEKPGKVHYLQAAAQHIPSDFFKYSSHAFSLAEAVELARVLDQLPPQLIVYGVEGEDFSHGEGLSPAVLTVMGSVLQRIIDDLVSNMIIESNSYA